MSSKFWLFFFVAEKSFKSRRLILGRAGGMWTLMCGEQQGSVWSDARGSILAHDSASVGLAFMTLSSTAWLWNDLFSNRGEAKTSYSGPQKAKVLQSKANMAGLSWRHLARIVMIFSNITVMKTAERENNWRQKRTAVNWKTANSLQWWRVRRW